MKRSRKMISAVMAGAMILGSVSPVMAAEGSLDLMTQWTSGGDQEAFNALVDVYTKNNPDVEMNISAVAGDNGTNKTAALATRIEGGDVPDIFQANGGMDAKQYIDAGIVQNIDDLVEAGGWKDLFPEGILSMCSKDDSIYGIPMNIGRDNMVWYNKAAFEKAGAEVPTTWDEFFTACDALKEAGITPVALGDSSSSWSTLILEDILIGELGAEGHDNLFSGDLAFDDEGVKTSAETFVKVLDYVNDNHSALSWQEAAELVSTGDAAMIFMGDWACGYFSTLEMVPGEDFGWFASPGTDDCFLAEFDTFLIPEDAKNADAAKAFVETMATTDAQVSFNQLKASIPARTDIGTDDFNVYTAAAMDDFKTLHISPSLIGKAAAPTGFYTKFCEAVTMLVTQKDVDQFITQALDDASLL